MWSLLWLNVRTKMAKIATFKVGHGFFALKLTLVGVRMLLCCFRNHRFAASACLIKYFVLCLGELRYLKSEATLNFVGAILDVLLESTEGEVHRFILNEIEKIREKHSVDDKPNFVQTLSPVPWRTVFSSPVASSSSLRRVSYNSKATRLFFRFPEGW